MKVVKRGVPPSERIWMGTCHNCKSQMEEVETKLTNPRHDQRDGHMAQETCPVCGSHFWMYPQPTVFTNTDIREVHLENPSYPPYTGR